jgi:predicted DNA-binding transcriptional regulator AlpA
MRHDIHELDAMSPAAFEAFLFSDFAVPRTDICENEIGASRTATDALAVFPDRARELLQFSQSDLVRWLRAGWLRRPGKLAGGRVAWRRDEITAQIPHQARQS